MAELKCPNCGGACERDEVDNGVGMEACGPWGCPECHWAEEKLDLDSLMREVSRPSSGEGQ